MDLETTTATLVRINTSENETGGCGNNVNDIGLDKTTRLLILYVTIVLNIVGSVLVLLWMACNRRISPRFNHLSRVNAFILNLTMADILVILLAVLPQLIWEYVDREWSAGPVMCRLVKYIQSFSMMSSNYILVVIAVDRHQAILAPLRESISVWKMAGTGWGLAALLSAPVLGVFHTNTMDGKTLCENIFRYLPVWHRQLWMTYVAVVVFFIPLVLLVICYTRIFLEISKKASQNVKQKNNFKPGKLQLQSNQSGTLPKAKIKTLKMTFAIIMVFIVCSLPYFIVEMIMSYGNHCNISKKLYGLLGGMAACNSATNPFVFLAFNVKVGWLESIFKCDSKNGSPSRGYNYCPTGSSGVLNSHNNIHRNSLPPFVRQDTKESQLEMKILTH